MDLKEKIIYIAGHKGMVGSSVHRMLEAKGCKRIVTQSLDQLNLIRQQEVENFYQNIKPDMVVVAAAKVGGIHANNVYRAQFIYENLMIEANLIHAAYQAGVEKLVFLGSSCIYPKLAAQPMREEALLTDVLEQTNEPYAIAKIAGIKLCESYYRQYGSNFFSLMPTNLYGPNDNYHLENSHVLPALLRKFHEAKISGSSEVTVWGSGKVKRDFMYVDDVAAAIVFALEKLNAAEVYNLGITHLNVGTGVDVTIAELAEVVKSVVQFQGEIVYDSSKPDGTPRKLMDSSRLESLGWKYTTNLETGVQKAYDWYLQNAAVAQ